MSGLTPDLLMLAYARGLFPMAERRDADEFLWVDPRRRGVLPLDGFHISRSLARRMRRGGYGVTVDRAFARVLDACAARDETWINDEIREQYLALHAVGRAHSLEVWYGEQLAGGVYGVALGAAFFGESMFSHATDASKIALAHLCDHLRQRGFRLFDTQFLTTHLASLGAVEITRAEYQRRLAEAITSPADFAPGAPLAAGHEVVQRSSQTS
jgi:leucyl/phenylalanyl-tRNA--protein transferase